MKYARLMLPGERDPKSRSSWVVAMIVAVVLAGYVVAWQGQPAEAQSVPWPDRQAQQLQERQARALERQAAALERQAAMYEAHVRALEALAARCGRGAR